MSKRALQIEEAITRKTARAATSTRDLQIEAMQITPEELAIIDRIVTYAEDNYGYGAWDQIVECYEVKDLCEELREYKLTSWTKALAHFRYLVALKHEQRRSIMAEAR